MSELLPVLQSSYGWALTITSAGLVVVFAILAKLWRGPLVLAAPRCNRCDALLRGADDDPLGLPATCSECGRSVRGNDRAVRWLAPRSPGIRRRCVVALLGTLLVLSGPWVVRTLAAYVASPFATHGSSDADLLPASTLMKASASLDPGAVLEVIQKYETSGTASAANNVRGVVDQLITERTRSDAHLEQLLSTMERIRAAEERVVRTGAWAAKARAASANVHLPWETWLGLLLPWLAEEQGFTIEQLADVVRRVRPRPGVLVTERCRVGDSIRFRSDGVARVRAGRGRDAALIVDVYDRLDWAVVQGASGAFIRSQTPNSPLDEIEVPISASDDVAPGTSIRVVWQCTTVLELSQDLFATGSAAQTPPKAVHVGSGPGRALVHVVEPHEPPDWLVTSSEWNPLADAKLDGSIVMSADRLRLDAWIGLDDSPSDPELEGSVSMSIKSGDEGDATIWEGEVHATRATEAPWLIEIAIDDVLPEREADRIRALPRPVLVVKYEVLARPWSVVSDTRRLWATPSVVEIPLEWRSMRSDGLPRPPTWAQSEVPGIRVHTAAPTSRF
jgi:hypothetical protein